MVTNARKTDAQRLGNGKKAFNIKQIEEKIANLPSTEDIEEMLETKQDVLTAGDNITIVDNVISATGGSDEWVEVNDIQTEKNTYFDSQTYTPKKDVLIVVDYSYSQSGTTMQNCRMHKEFYYMKGIVVPNTTCTIVGERINDIKSNCDVSFTNINIRSLIDLSENGVGISITNSSIRIDLSDKTISVFGQGSTSISKNGGAIKIYYKA